VDLPSLFVIMYLVYILLLAIRVPSAYFIIHSALAILTSMFYTSKNFASKKSLKESVAKGDKITIYAPGLGTPPENGSTAVGGPHYPKPHSWYAEVTMRNGVIVKVK